MTKNLLILDQSILPQKEVFLPFALTDVLTELAGSEQQYLLHFWQLEQTFILGMKDTRVTDLAAGIAAVSRKGYTPVVRNSGGLGVIADQGILNVSLILPSPQTHKIAIDHGYQAMLQLVQSAFPDQPITAGEVANSYCPGTFDLRIGQLKFAGLAQRRIKDGVAVMMYLSVNGPQQKRGAAVRDFYQAALKDRFGTAGYPPVDPASMANLADLLPQPLTVASVKEQLLHAAGRQFQLTQKILPTAGFLSEPQRLAQLQQKFAGMVQRNQIIKELCHDDPLQIPAAGD